MGENSTEIDVVRLQDETKHIVLAIEQVKKDIEKRATEEGVKKQFDANEKRLDGLEKATNDVNTFRLELEKIKSKRAFWLAVVTLILGSLGGGAWLGKSFLAARSSAEVAKTKADEVNGKMAQFDEHVTKKMLEIERTAASATTQATATMDDAARSAVDRNLKEVEFRRAGRARVAITSSDFKKRPEHSDWIATRKMIFDPPYAHSPLVFFAPNLIDNKGNFVQILQGNVTNHDAQVVVLVNKDPGETSPRFFIDALVLPFVDISFRKDKPASFDESGISLDTFGKETQRVTPVRENEK